MINTPTVIVLGAGASLPYGLLSGAELRGAICTCANGAGSELALALRQVFPSTQISNFATEFLNSRISSIDSFLARRSEYVAIGKYAISILLCANENPERLSNPIDSKDDWYFEFWNRLHSGVQSENDLAQNKIKIVTFNYDRSLEHYLYLAIKHSFGVDDAHALDILKSHIPILHLYGSLGEFGLNLQDKYRPYSINNSERALQLAAQGIQIIPEMRDTDQAFEKAREWFRWAERICFLGFSFEELNVKRLGLKQVITERNQQVRTTPGTIIASSFGKTPTEMNTARLLLGAENITFQHSNEHVKSLRTLKEHSWVLD